MKTKNIILDILINDSEAITQIKEYFNLLNVSISLKELRETLNDMVDEELIYKDNKWFNELGEKPYTITIKGKQEWEKTYKTYSE